MAKRRSYDSPAGDVGRPGDAQASSPRLGDPACGGYDGMTSRGSPTPGVSPKTVYNSIGGKAQVVRRWVYDVMLAGDDDPTPMSQRPAFLALSTNGDPETFFRAYAHLSRLIFERVGPLLGVTPAGRLRGDANLAPSSPRSKASGAPERHALTPPPATPASPTSGGARLHDIVWTLTAPRGGRPAIRQMRLVTRRLRDLARRPTRRGSCVPR